MKLPASLCVWPRKPTFRKFSLMSMDNPLRTKTSHKPAVAKTKKKELSPGGVNLDERMISKQQISKIDTHPVLNR